MDTINKLLKVLKTEILFWLFLGAILLLASCNKDIDRNTLAYKAPTKDIKKDTYTKEVNHKPFNKYWYSGEAEISSYKLEQARYGELRQGTAVLIYVTEDFLPEIQVKADYKNDKNVSVLKLNATKNFNTGIYPYTIMQSTFFPVTNNKHAIKVSSSMQEWCGHAYIQLNNRSQFNIMLHSYFEGEADKNISLNKTILENELWTKLRIDPKSLPTGTLKIIPAFEYIRLKHVPIKAFPAKATLEPGLYTVNYPDLERSISIRFNPEFPYNILGWDESFKSGFGAKAKVLTTKATLQKTIKTPYWEKNTNKDEFLRDSLLLK